MALPYTSGNWTIDSLHVDHVQTPKTLSVTTVSPAEEYTASLMPPLNAKGVDLDQVMYYSDQTGTGLQPVGSMTIGRKAVRNVYSSSTIAASEQLPQKGGQRVYLNLGMHYRVTNSVSGAEYVIPLTGTVAVTVPTWSAIPHDVLDDFANHLVGVIAAGGTGSSPYVVLYDAFRGDIDITR